VQYGTLLLGLVHLQLIHDNVLPSQKQSLIENLAKVLGANSMTSVIFFGSLLADTSLSSWLLLRFQRILNDCSISASASVSMPVTITTIVVKGF